VPDTLTHGTCKPSEEVEAIMLDEHGANSARAHLTGGDPRSSSAAMASDEQSQVAHLREVEACLREAERRLRHGEDRYQALLEATAQIGWTTPPDGEIVDVPLWRRYTGQSLGEVRGWGWLNAIHPDDRERATTTWARALASGSGYETEYRLRRADGAYRTFLARCVPIREASGSIREWVGCGTDITERKRLEDTLAQTALEAAARANELDAIFESLPDGIVFYDEQGRILRANGLAREFLSIGGATDAWTRPIDERTHLYQLRNDRGEPLPSEQGPAKRVVSGEILAGTDSVDIYMSSQDGREWTLNVGGMPIRDAHGRQIGAVCVFRDVAERRRLERRTRETLDALLAIAEDMTCAPEEEREEPGIASATSAMTERLLTLACGLLNCERVAVTTLDAPSGALRPLAALGLTAEEERLWTAELPDHTLETYFDPQQIARLGAGEVLWVERDPLSLIAQRSDVASPVLTAPLTVGDQLAGLLSIDFGAARHEVRDDERMLAAAIAKLATLLVERERLVRERAAAQARALTLQDVNRKLDNFLGIASHELRTPLTSVKINIQMALKLLRTLTEGQNLSLAEIHAVAVRAHELLDRADHQFSRQNRLITDLLEATRLGSRRLDMHREPVDLADVVQNVVAEQRANNPDREITTSLVTGPVPVVADVDRIGQVVTNYLTNALKYSSADAPVSVWLRVRGSVAKVSVRDRGQGLPPEEQGRVWKRFYRVESIHELSGSSVGLGLGLFLCKMIIDQHGGQVGLLSKPGRGATFWFALPLAQDASVHDS
jgi:PAS domain S-box-containing protein